MFHFYTNEKRQKIKIPHVIELFTRLQIGLSPLREHRFRRNFQDSLDPFCNCGWHIETTIHFFLHYSNYSNKRKTLFHKISNTKRSLLNQSDVTIVEALFFGSNSLNNKENALIIESIIEYIITTERFIAPFLWVYLSRSPLFLRSLIHSGSPYFIFLSCLVVQNILYIYIYIFIFHVRLNVYRQGYVVCICLSWYFSFLYCVYYIHRKKSFLTFSGRIEMERWTKMG